MDLLALGDAVDRSQGGAGGTVVTDMSLNPGPIVHVQEARVLSES